MKTRLQRFLADCGVASRREAEAMIQAGRVRVNGQVRTAMPVMVDTQRDIITVDEQEVVADGQGGGLKEQPRVYYLLNKPKGVLVTNYDPEERKTVGELMKGVKERVFPVGRLDMDSRGALLMTNDGELANRLAHPRYGVEKTYIVEVDGRIGHDDLEKIKRGVWLGPEHPGAKGGGKTERFGVKLIGRERGRTLLEVRISEGRNREIRRVMARIGHPVRDLNRVAIAGRVTIKGLDIGEFRPLTDQEVAWLFKASSPMFHDERKAATQAWYEAKEMEKERKRLARQSTSAGDRTGAPPGGGSQKTPSARPRPQHKGRKPFVPPSGRNAGVALGGNERGRRRLGRESPSTVPAPVGGKAIVSPSRAAHPLGNAARREDQES